MADNLYTSPIVLMFGPSGAGKSTLAHWLELDLSFLHINFDRWDGQGFDARKFSHQWSNFFRTYQVDDLAEAVYEFIATHNKKSAVLTFPSDVIPTPKHMLIAKEHGLIPLILYAEPEDCLAAYMQRESARDSHLGPRRWKHHDKSAFAHYRQAEFAPYKIYSFVDHVRRDRTSLIEAVHGYVAHLS